MRTHHPMQTDTPLKMMNSAAPATIQAAVEKRRKVSIMGGSLWTFTFGLVYVTSSYRRQPAEEASAEVGRCRVPVMLAPKGLAAEARQVALAPLNDPLVLRSVRRGAGRARASNILSMAIDRVLSREP